MPVVYLQPYIAMPGRFASTTKNEGSRAVSRLTGDPNDIRNEGDHSGSIQNSKRSILTSNSSSVGLRHSRRLLPDINPMRSHSSG